MRCTQYSYHIYKLLKMAQVKMGFSELNIPEQIQRAHLVHDSMASSSNFPNATNELVAMDNANDLLEQAYQDSRDGGKTKVATMHLRNDEMLKNVVVLAGIVQSVSKGDAEIIRSSGFDVRNTAGASGLPSQPQGVKVATSPYPGQALINWKPVGGARSYSIEKSDDGLTGWVVCGTSTRSKATVDGLRSMTNVWFCVTAIGIVGQSPASISVQALIR